jgi:signal transduction histidine kinase
VTAGRHRQGRQWVAKAIYRLSGGPCEPGLCLFCAAGGALRHLLPSSLGALVPRFLAPHQSAPRPLWRGAPPPGSVTRQDDAGLALRLTSLLGGRPYAWAVAAIYAWLRRHPGLVDGVPAVALAFLGLGQAIALFRYSLIPVLLALVIALAFRRRYPVAAFITGIVVGLVQILVGIRPNVIDVAIVILLYTLAAYRPRRLSLPGLGVCLIGSAVAITVWRPITTSLLDWVITGAIIFAGPSLIAWVVGDSMRYRRAYYAALEDRAARLERERDAQAQIAAAAERARIARELHDVVAHNVSVMVVQADGASYALDRSPERARQALAAISSTGRQALSEMRRMLGVLRSDDGETGVAPLPGIAQLGELLVQTRATGLAVSFTVEGVPAPLPGGLALAAYRIVQESLTNTRKHGGPAASAQVLLRYCEDVLVLQITDDGFGAAASADGGGHGLTGMRERVALYNGTLQAGPLPGGGYQVTARLPVVRQRARAADWTEERGSEERAPRATREGGGSKARPEAPDSRAGVA